MQKKNKKRTSKKSGKHPKRAVHKAKKLFGFKYPKLFLLALSIFLAYYLFSNPEISEWVGSLNRLNYLGMFIAGILFAFGFTAPFSIGFFLSINPQNIFLAAFIATLGSVFANLIIFKSIRFSFMDEFKEIEKTEAIQRIEKIIKNKKHSLIKHYLFYIFIGIFLATPLPDEIGVSMLAGLTKIKPINLVIISFILHALPILLLIYVGAGI